MHPSNINQVPTKFLQTKDFQFSLHYLKEKMVEHDATPTFPHHAHTLKQQTKMGCGQQWTAHEKKMAAVTYQKASIDPTVGTDQKLAIFTNKLIEFMTEQVSKSCESNCYHHCSLPSIHI